ncbi:hypothetical protein ACWEPZ_01340 [Streptomyces sp. NPDC004288]|uniref:hypothetical protein n=1 Tax=unclassified Streptomyces TaxID=2593676 RepID=UPI002E77F330|nr:hypothetical protein [Streptomyces sp. SP18ES09]MEE1815063.1 hypothetical protein [Streptomyces sp. SP18ES09]
MSVAQNTGIRKAVRQLLVAMVACTAVAGGAAFAVGSADAPVTPQTVAGVTEDNGWPVVPPKPTPTN